MLGLSSGLVNPDYTTSLVNLEDVSGLIAHYDFSDASKLKQNSDGTTAVSSNNDPIGYAENLVSNGLGTFVRSYSDAGRPLYKTGGTNSKSYAQFDGTGGSTSGCGLVAGIQPDNDVFGGISASVYSDLTLHIANLSLFIVCASDVEDISSNECLLEMSGLGDPSDTQNKVQLMKQMSDRAQPIFMYGGDPTSNSAVLGSTWTTEDRLMSLVTGPPDITNATSLQVDDNSASVTSLNANEKLEMKSSAGNVNFIIGARSNDYLNPNTDNWEGKVYEILLYNRSVNDAEKTIIKNYINTKYALWS